MKLSFEMSRMHNRPFGQEAIRRLPTHEGKKVTLTNI